MASMFVIREHEEVVPLADEPYRSEKALQELLERYPMLLAGEQFDSDRPRRWLLVKRELGIPDELENANRWAVDHLFLDQDAIPTFVEVKRSTDTRIRREVVGQMLDYAANATAHWPVERLQREYDSTASASGDNPEAKLAEFLGVDTDSTRFWNQAKLNLRAGKIRLVFVSDELPVELRRIIEFLNEQMDPAEVLGLEIRQFVGQGIRSLVPTLVGRTTEASQRKEVAGTTKPWDEHSFLDVLKERNGESEAAIAQHILNWAKSRGYRIWWGRGSKDASFYPLFDDRGSCQCLIAVRSGVRSAYIQLQLPSMVKPFDADPRRSELLAKLRNQLGWASDKKYPGFPLGDLAPAEKMKALEDIFDWVVHETRCSE